MRRAARLGDGWMPYLVSPDAYARSVATIRAEAAAAGRDLDRLRVDAVPVLLGPAPTATGPATTWRRSSAAPTATSPRAMLDRIAPAGTPDEVAARLQAYVDAGVRHIVISPAAHDDTLEVVTAGRRGGPAPAQPPGGVPVSAEATPRRCQQRGPDVSGPGGLSVVEVAVGASDLGLGLAGGVPGMILADLGADVDPRRRHRRRPPSTPASPGAGPGTATSASSPPTTADEIARAAGRRRRRPRLRARGAGRAARARLPRPATRPTPRWSTPAAGRAARPTGEVDDYGLLVEARAGFCTQLAGHRPRADLRRRAGHRRRRRVPADHLGARPAAPPGPRPAAAGWAETSLYDGMLATLGCMIGRSERAPAPRSRGTGRRARRSPTSSTAAPTAS